MTRFYDILNGINSYLTNQANCGIPSSNHTEDMEDELELQMVIKKLQELRQSKSDQATENETIEQEILEYKKDFYEMSLGSIKAIATHANNILSALDNPKVAENLTESWLQGKIAITEDYMRTIHDFVMFVSDAADTTSGGDRPGLWENIRRKKERMGKKYRPAQPGDKDRPNTEQWKKLTKKNKPKD